MLDEKDLQAIAEMISASEARMMAHTDQAIEASERRMDDKLAASERRMDDKLAASEARMMAHTDQAIEASERRMQILMEGIFMPRFNFLADGQSVIREKMVTKEDLRDQREDMQAEIFLLKAAVKQNAREIEKLKRA